MGYSVLLIGNGGREHAIAAKIKESVLCTQLWIAPGNPGTAEIGNNIPLNISDSSSVIQFCKKQAIDLVMIGPELPLVTGLADELRAQHIPTVGPGALGAQLEGSKAFSKDFFQKYHIQTARYQNFKQGSSYQEILAWVRTIGFPVVLKCDGLAAGKGVVICENEMEVLETLTLFWENQAFGDAAQHIVIEQFLSGIEVSILVCTDGKDYVILPEAKDYKRIGDADTGGNTGGMGAVSPVPFVQGAFLEQFKQKILEPTLKGLQAEGIPFQGVLFAGLMNVQGEPYILEYNVRMGDPETQVILPRIESDFLELLWLCANQKLSDYNLKVSEQISLGVILASAGYPGTFEKNKKIKVESSFQAQLWVAGVQEKAEEWFSSGGRVCMVQALAPNVIEAREKVYQELQKIHFEGKYYRKDIGLDILS